MIFLKIFIDSICRYYFRSLFFIHHLFFNLHFDHSKYHLLHLHHHFIHHYPHHYLFSYRWYLHHRFNYRFIRPNLRHLNHLGRLTLSLVKTTIYWAYRSFTIIFVHPIKFILGCFHLLFKLEFIILFAILKCLRLCFIRQDFVRLKQGDHLYLVGTFFWISSFGSNIVYDHQMLCLNKVSFISLLSLSNL